MKRTALILAGAAVFDLGVMAVSAQAQPGRQDDFVNQGLITNSNSKLSAQAEPTRPTGPASASPGSPAGAAPVWDPTGTGGCTPGSPLSGGTANPCAPGAINGQAVVGGHKGELTTFLKLDRVNTIQACTARRGEVVMHEGARQCRIPPPPPAAPSVGNPARRPDRIPPR